MSKNPDLTEIEKQMEKGETFELTTEQYLLSTGINLPQNKSYTENRSAVAKVARVHGFRIRVEEKIIFIKEAE